MDLVNEILLLASQGEPAGRYNTSFSLDDTMTVVGLVFMVIFMIISTLSGVSGNNIILPICLIFFKFDSKVAVAHTSLLATLSCAVRILYERMQPKSVTEDNELINFHLVLLGTAPAVLGSFIGVQANHVSPTVVITGLTTCLQIFLCIYSFRGYLKKKAEEDKKHEKEVSPELEEGLEKKIIDDAASKNTTEGSSTPLDASLAVPLIEGDVRDTMDIDILEPIDPRRDQYKITSIDLLIMAGLMTLNPIISTLRASSGSTKWYQAAKCSGADVIILLSYLILLVVISVLLAKNVLYRNFNKKLGKKDLSIKETSYTLKFVMGVMGVSFVGGFLAAGSTTLLSIFMISLGVYPFISSSTTMVLAVIFSGSSSILYALNGLVYLSCVVIAGTVVVASTVLTRMTLYQSFLKHGKASLILLFISITMVVTVPSNIIQVYPHLKEDIQAGKNIWAFTSFCP